MWKVLMSKFATLNPFFLVSIIFVFLGVYVVGISSKNPQLYLLALFMWLVAALIQTLWPLAACVYLAPLSDQKSNKILIHLLKWCFVSVAIFIILLFVALMDKYTNINTRYIDYMHNIAAPEVIIVLYVYFRSSWQAAKMLLQAERGNEVQAGEVFATSLLFIYWLLGVFFLHGRLKKLQSKVE